MVYLECRFSVLLNDLHFTNMHAHCCSVINCIVCKPGDAENKELLGGYGETLKLSLCC